MTEKLLCSKCGISKDRTGENYYAATSGAFYGPCKPCVLADRAARRAAKRDTSGPVTVVQEGHKVCPKCKREQRLDCFRTACLRGVERVQSWCRSCERESQRVRKASPKGKMLAKKYRASAHARNPSKGAQRAKDWRESNKELYLKRSRAMYFKHRAKRIEYARNKSALLRQRIEGGEFITDQEIAIQYTRQKSRCFYCDCQLGEGGAIANVDHFIPLARGGANTAQNIVIACKQCNQRKWAKMPWEFMPDRFSMI